MNRFIYFRRCVGQYLDHWLGPCVIQQATPPLAPLSVGLQTVGLQTFGGKLSDHSSAPFRPFSYRFAQRGNCSALVLGFIALCGVASASATPPPDAITQGFGGESVVQSTDNLAAQSAGPGVELSQSEKDKLKLEALLAETGVPEVEGERCIRRQEIRQFKILSSSLLLIEGRHNKRWINQFPHRCVGLRKNMTLVMKVFGSQLCSLDTIYGRDRFDSGISSLGSASCSLSKFQEISVEQADALKLASKNNALP